MITIPIIFNLISYLIFASIDVLLINFYLDANYKKKYKNNFLILIFCVIVLATINVFFSRLRLENILCYLFVLFIIVSLYDIKLKNKFTITSLMFIIIFTADITCTLVFEWLFDIHFKTGLYVKIEILKNISMLLCKYFEYFILYTLISDRYKNKIFNLHYFKIISSIIQ